MLINGQIKIEQQTINERDALGIWETERVEILTKQESRILLIEVPMKF